MNEFEGENSTHQWKAIESTTEINTAILEQADEIKKQIEENSDGLKVDILSFGSEEEFNNFLAENEALQDKVNEKFDRIYQAVAGLLLGAVGSAAIHGSIIKGIIPQLIVMRESIDKVREEQMFVASAGILLVIAGVVAIGHAIQSEIKEHNAE